ncbi:MAG: hypothetical protein KZQ83_06285 [gamma proteobacterium symbiont of Taylorina sp.]|nr:hypothetical protein [gamma proteobacterium symbiont of Taylorina sp.]
MSCYCLFFSGEIHEDFELDEVKSDFKSHFNLSDEQVGQYFSGHEIIIQSNLSQIAALDLMVEIEEIGGIAYFLPLDGEVIITAENSIGNNNKKPLKTEKIKHDTHKANIEFTNNQKNHEKKYQLFFSSDIQDDFDLEDVKTNFKSHLNLSDIQLKQYFSGTEITILSDLTQLETLTLLAELEELGGICYFLPIEENISLPDGVKSNRRKAPRRKRVRRHSYRAGLHSDRRSGGDRRKSVYKY